MGETEIARLGALQHGCAHRQQLLDAGIGRGAIAHRLRTQRFRPLHRGVYLVDPVQADVWTPHLAAVLLFGGDAVASHLLAGALWGMLDEIPPKPELTLVGRSAHPQPGLTVHRTATLDRDDIATRHRLPVTSPARTLLDLAAVLPPIELEAALAEARHRRLVTHAQLDQAITRAPRHAGVAELRRLLADDAQLSRTRSHYERRLLQMIRAAGLPSPLTNVKVEGHLVDMAWPDRRLIVEFDGFKYHADRRAFEIDRRRDQDLVAAGYRVIRITARQIEEEPLAVLARLAAALAR